MRAFRIIEVRKKATSELESARTRRLPHIPIARRVLLFGPCLIFLLKHVSLLYPYYRPFFSYYNTL